MNTHTANILYWISSTVEEINIQNKNITGILDLEKFTNLKKLICNYNSITNFINLPETLNCIECQQNQITQLDNLQPVACTKCNQGCTC